MKPPVKYISDFVAAPDNALTSLQTELEWERRDDAPRSEYYCNDFPFPYQYGRGRGQREYLPRPYNDTIMRIRKSLELMTNSVFEVCFLNRYLNQSDQLGWHADDSPEMDDSRPIGIVSFGVEREIWFKPKDLSIKSEPVKLKLGHGSLCVMEAGMQDSWLHRIPKASFQCGERISLTFRGYVKPTI